MDADGFRLHIEDLLVLITYRHLKKISTNRYVRRLGKDSFAFRVKNP